MKKWCVQLPSEFYIIVAGLFWHHNSKWFGIRLSRTILQTMGPICEEQLLIAYKTALDIKAHALRLNDDFMDRVLATTKILLGMQLIDDPTHKLEFNDGMTTLLANSFKNIILKNSSFPDLANALDLGCDGY